MNNDIKSPVAQATDMMLEAMQKLLKKEMSAADASAIALNGKMIVDAAREATSFTKVTGFIPTDSAFGDKFRPIEPKVTRAAIAAQTVRLNNAEALEILPAPAKRGPKGPRDPWKSYDDEVV